LKPFVPCPDSPDGKCHWLSEDFPDDEGWDLFCEYCYRWKDWDEAPMNKIIHQRDRVIIQKFCVECGGKLESSDNENSHTNLRICIRNLKDKISDLTKERKDYYE
jgi:hypothetical protein